MKRIALIHFLPLELYPPVMNFIDYWAEKVGSSKLEVYTTKNARLKLQRFTCESTRVKIRRFGLAINNSVGLIRWLHYCIYYITCLISLIITRPQIVFYYDTISAFPAYLYKIVFNRKAVLFIHYHEYMSKEEYASGMVLVRWFHSLERKMYRSATWVSHTNQQRMNRFLEDGNQINAQSQHVLPNFPPATWNVEKRGKINYPIKIVSIGAVGLQTMYTQEFAEWVQQQNGRVTWDIYSLTVSPDAETWLKQHKFPFLVFKGGVDYQQLPDLLSKYDIGVILYKGHIPNFIFNAPNKLFEYHICGLDTWFPAQMATACEYVTHGTYPKIVPINFAQLDSLNLDEVIDRTDAVYWKTKYTADSVFVHLTNAMVG